MCPHWSVVVGASRYCRLLTQCNCNVRHIIIGIMLLFGVCFICTQWQLYINFAHLIIAPIHIIIIRTDVNSVVVTLPLWAILLLVVLPFFVIASLVGMGIACKCLSIKREKRIIASSIEKWVMSVCITAWRFNNHPFYMYMYMNILLPVFAEWRMLMITQHLYPWRQFPIVTLTLVSWTAAIIHMQIRALTWQHDCIFAIN